MAAKKVSILIVDDDPRIVRLVKHNLEFAGYQTLSAYDGQQALEQIAAQEPTLVLLDVNMPKLNGFEVCERVREFSTVPIVIITAREQEQDLIRGLDLGADDYLTKPFSTGELLARVRAALRRSHWDVVGVDQDIHPNMRVGALTLDFAQRLVTVDNHVVELTPIEFRLLAYLAQNVGRVVTPDLLLAHVWGEEYVEENHLLIVNINRLRRKVERDPTRPVYILTRKGIGYLIPSQLAPASLACAATSTAHDGTADPQKSSTMERSRSRSQSLARSGRSAILPSTVASSAVDGKIGYSGSRAWAAHGERGEDAGREVRW